MAARQFQSEGCEGEAEDVAVTLLLFASRLFEEGDKMVKCVIAGLTNEAKRELILNFRFTRKDIQKMQRAIYLAAQKEAAKQHMICQE